MQLFERVGGALRLDAAMLTKAPKRRVASAWRAHAVGVGVLLAQVQVEPRGEQPAEQVVHDFARLVAGRRERSGKAGPTNSALCTDPGRSMIQTCGVLARGGGCERRRAGRRAPASGRGRPRRARSGAADVEISHGEHGQIAGDVVLRDGSAPGPRASASPRRDAAAHGCSHARPPQRSHARQRRQARRLLAFADAGSRATAA